LEPSAPDAKEKELLLSRSDGLLEVISSAVSDLEPRAEAFPRPTEVATSDSKTVLDLGALSTRSSPLPVGLIGGAVGINVQAFPNKDLPSPTSVEVTFEPKTRASAASEPLAVDSLLVPAPNADLPSEEVAASVEATLMPKPTVAGELQLQPDLNVSSMQASPIAPSTTESADPVPTAATEKLQPRVGTVAWETALGQRVCWMIGDHQQTASLMLDPPELGPLQVVVTMNNDQATAAFFAPEPEVRRALEAAIPRLREMMDAAGIQLGDATVGSGASGNHDAPSSAKYRQQTDPQGDIDPGQRVAGNRLMVRSISQGLVDTFA
jgi:flagellar hook-length control protein FliK